MTQDNQNNQSEAQVPKDQTGLATGVTEQEHQQAQTDNVITHDPLTSEYNPNQIPNNDADKRLNIKFGDKFLNNWNENGIFRVMVVICSFVFILVLIGIFKFFFGGSSVPDQVDGSKTKFDAPQTNAGEAEVVTQEQYQYIRAQEAILAQRAKEKGESYTPRNLVIAQGTGTGQAVLPTTSNAANGVSADQVNGALFNSTQGLNYNGTNSQGQQGQGQQGQVQQTQYAQPQYIQIPDNASPVANQYMQSNNEFASWYEQESQRQISENEKSEGTVNTFVGKQIKALSGEDENGKRNGKNAGGYAVQTYAVAPKLIADNGQNFTGNGQQGSGNLNYGGGSSVNGSNTGNGKVLIPAGTRVTARLLNDVNTDDGDQVFAQFVTGKLKGRKVLGSVKKSQDNIQFSMTRVLSDGKQSEFSIDAVGQTLQGSFGMATHIDRHIMKNSAAMVASGVAKGYGNAYRDNATNTAYTNGAVIVNQQDPSNKRIAGNIAGQLGEDFGSKIESIYGNKPTTFRTPVGTVFYIFVNKDITE